MSVSPNAPAITNGLRKSLSKSDANILDGMVCIDMQVTVCFYVQVDHAVSRDLVQHMLKEG